MQVGNQVVAENVGTTALSAASLTKIATTLAAISTWGVDHQFETIVSATAQPQNGVVTGDLIVQGGGDPFFVWEEAIALANALQEMGVDRVTGNLVIAGNFAMNFQTDPAASGRLLRQGMNSGAWNAEASNQFARLPQGTARPNLRIDGDVRVVSLSEAQARSIVPVVRHRSLPLSQILKAMNSFSNNAMSEMLAVQLGGGAKVAQTVAQTAKVPPEEIQLINGSGLGTENRISPRAVTAMLLAIQTYLQPQQLNVADVFPVMGRDRGTLGRRQMPAGAAVKTGTLNEVSSLAGVIPSARGQFGLRSSIVGLQILSELHRSAGFAAAARPTGVGSRIDRAGDSTGESRSTSGKSAWRTQSESEVRFAGLGVGCRASAGRRDARSRVFPRLGTENWRSPNPFLDTAR
ncbi:MAG: D-alanyl-D-alanine carboxypeptidase [Leptolyngbyaceae cyanobacterium SM1_3_5]|nr:D-alanyl-D-alanine carboxypeptidase [Leptolyngbyaceae cyanobacterium SM1_3_5]